MTERLRCRMCSKELTIDLREIVERNSFRSPRDGLERNEFRSTNGVKMEFVLIPAGSFLMGSDKGLKDERPVHRVVISRPFYLAKYEVTQSQWETVMGKDARLTEYAMADNELVGPHKAMNEMSWNIAQEFVGKLKAKAPSHAYALSTEAQWEYACRAGSTTEFSFGDDAAALGDYAWFQGNMNWVGHPGFKGKAFYHDVGMKKPNAFGLYDMHGGVWEWCADRYDPDYYFTAPLVDPRGPESGRFRVLRGGSWFRFAKYARSAYRREFHPDGDGDAITAYIVDFGCRVAINLPPNKWSSLTTGESACRVTQAQTNLRERLPKACIK